MCKHSTQWVFLFKWLWGSHDLLNCVSPHFSLHFFLLPEAYAELWSSQEGHIYCNLLLLQETYQLLVALGDQIWLKICSLDISRFFFPLLNSVKGKVKSINLSSAWWIFFFQKWVPLMYMLNISSTWESWDGAHIWVWDLEWRTLWMCSNPCHKSMSV